MPLTDEVGQPEVLPPIPTPLAQLEDSTRQSRLHRSTREDTSEHEKEDGLQKGHNDSRIKGKALPPKESLIPVSDREEVLTVARGR